MWRRVLLINIVGARCSENHLHSLNPITIYNMALHWGFIFLHFVLLRCIILVFNAPKCIALQRIALHYIAMHCIALQCIALHCIVRVNSEWMNPSQHWSSRDNLLLLIDTKQRVICLIAFILTLTNIFRTTTRIIRKCSPTAWVIACLVKYL